LARTYKRLRSSVPMALETALEKTQTMRLITTVTMTQSSGSMLTISEMKLASETMSSFGQTQTTIWSQIKLLAAMVPLAATIGKNLRANTTMRMERLPSLMCGTKCLVRMELFL